MAQGKVEICGVNTAKLPLLKADEKEKLFEQIESGDKEARQKYIEGNLRLVLSVIKRFSSSNENVDDLFQIGCIGLIKAIDNFDSSLNVKFSTYAVPMIITCRKRWVVLQTTRKQAILQAIEQLNKDEQNSSIVEKLKEILEEFPLSTWTQKSIIDTIETYAIEHGNMLPQAKDLISKNGLPSNTVIFNKFGITSVNIFLEKYFPMFNKQYKKYSPYNDKGKEYFVNTFIENYLQIKNKFNLKYVGSKIYDKNKEKGTPHTVTIIKNCNCESYEDLLILCGFKNPKKEIETTISMSYNDTDDQITELKTLLSGMNKL